MQRIVLLVLLISSFTIQANTFKSLTVDTQEVQDVPDGSSPDPEEGAIAIEPGLTIDDNTLKSQIVFTAKKPFLGSSTVSLLFDFTVNGGIDTGSYDDPEESSEQLITEYIADGGNVEIDLGLGYQIDDFYFGLGGYYSLLTTDAISTETGESEVLDVDAEIYGAKAMFVYDIGAVRLFGTYTSYDASDDGANADFTEILDDGESLSFGLELPLTSQAGGFADGDYILRLERTEHTDVDKAIFRVSIARPFQF